MKKILFPLLLVSSFAIYSQELDEAYLESLPGDVRKDVLEQIGGREELEKPIYRRPSTMIKKKLLQR